MMKYPENQFYDCDKKEQDEPEVSVFEKILNQTILFLIVFSLNSLAFILIMIIYSIFLHYGITYLFKPDHIVVSTLFPTILPTVITGAALYALNAWICRLFCDREFSKLWLKLLFTLIIILFIISPIIMIMINIELFSSLTLFFITFGAYPVENITEIFTTNVISCALLILIAYIIMLLKLTVDYFIKEAKNKP